MLKECKDTLSLQLKQFLHHNNPAKFIEHITTEQRIKAHAWGNYSSVSKNVTKVDNNLSKEECNKIVAALLCCLERFFRYLCLTPQGLIYNLGKKI